MNWNSVINLINIKKIDTYKAPTVVQVVAYLSIIAKQHALETLLSGWLELWKIRNRL